MRELTQIAVTTTAKTTALHGKKYVTVKVGSANVQVCLNKTDQPKEAFYITLEANKTYQFQAENGVWLWLWCKTATGTSTLDITVMDDPIIWMS